MNICDRIVVLEFGKVIAAGAPDDVRRDQQVVRPYLGVASAAEPAAAESPRRPGGAGNA